MKLRGHHLLCTLAYKGLGYSEEFTKNMDKIVHELKNEDVTIELINKVDDVCEKCPSKINNECEVESKVVNMDNKTIEALQLKKDTYTYKEIKCNIQKNITEEIIDCICGKCEWYSTANCKEIIMNKISSL